MMSPEKERRSRSTWALVGAVMPPMLPAQILEVLQDEEHRGSQDEPEHRRERQEAKRQRCGEPRARRPHDECPEGRPAEHERTEDGADRDSDNVRWRHQQAL